MRYNLDTQKLLSVDHVASIISVSPATIRNWVKAGYIIPTRRRPLAFSEDEVFSFRERIVSGVFDKLKTRANKMASTNVFFSDEYSNNASIAEQCNEIATLVRMNELDTNVVMFLAALRLLIAKGELASRGNSDLFDLSQYHSWSRESMKRLIYKWRDEIDSSQVPDSYNEVYELLVPQDIEDYLGMIYQSISIEGIKSRRGLYYTPSDLVENSLSQLRPPIKTFLDPCCGTGKFLLGAARAFDLALENIFGFDRDIVATYIARVNLLLAYPESDYEPNIRCMDSILELATGEMFCETNPLLNSIDAIATNPPWGAYKNETQKRHHNSRIKSNETFSLFVEKSLHLLRKGGQLSLILPESVLNIRAHADVRELLLRETSIVAIEHLGRRFAGVFTPVIGLNSIKGIRSKDHFVVVKNDDESNTVSQSRFMENEYYTFNIKLADYEEEVLKKIYAVEHATLIGNSEWALGIVTGNNKRFLSKEHKPGTEPIVRGYDVHPYRLRTPDTFINYAPNELQQTSREEFYRADEKLIYRFISNRLVFAYDTRRLLTLNSANILIPAIPGVSIKVTLAFLNSKVFQYIFRKKFSTHKVLRGDLERFPFPILDEKTHLTIEQLVDLAVDDGVIRKELDELVFSSFFLTDREISIITNSI